VGRRRLMSILSATVLAVGVCAGPAVALEAASELAADAESALSGGSDVIEMSTDPAAPGVTVDPGALVEGSDVEVPVPPMVVEVTPDGPEVGPAPADEPKAEAPQKAAPRPSGAVSGSSGGSVRDAAVAPAPAVALPTSAAIQRVPAGSRSVATNVMSPVAAEAMIDAPQVAPPAETPLVAAPVQAAPALPVLPDLPEVPLALRLATAALVAGTAGSWMLVRRTV
jgi:hypothetical protein